MKQRGAKNPYKKGSVRIIPDAKCEFCRITFRPRTFVSTFCSSECRVEGLHLRSIYKIFTNFSIDNETGCWNWEKSIGTGGYGQSNLTQRLSPVAHKVMYLLLRGDIKDGYQLDHLCRNRKCVNPDHLEQVTPAENVRRGLSAKLTDEDVKSIVSLVSLGKSQWAVARVFGINQSHVSRIIHGERRFN